MLIFNIIFIFFIIFIFYIINFSIINTSLYLSTGKKYSHKLLILPSMFTTFIWIFIYIIFYFITRYILNINFIDIIFKNNNLHNLLPIFLIFIGFCSLGILGQSFSCLLINLNKKDEYGTPYLNPSDILKPSEINYVENSFENSITNYYNIQKIKITDALIASLCSFTSLIFICTILLFIGYLFGKSLI